MPHPYARKSVVRRRRSWVPWTIALGVLVSVLASPWFLPESISGKAPMKYVKAVTTFPLEYEYTHVYKYAPPEDKNRELPSAYETVEEPVVNKPLFPLSMGNKWIYSHKKTRGMMNPDESVTEKVMEITEKKSFEDMEIYKVVSSENGKTEFAWYWWDIEGLHVSKDDKHPWVHSLLVLKASPVSGDEWREAGTTGRRDSVAGTETVTVPLGTFSCLLIESKTSSAVDRVYKIWYAEGTGIVRQAIGSQARGEDVWELMSFVSK